MALIQCPECAHEVSDQAVSCPNCGFPIAATPTSRTVHINITRDEDRSGFLWTRAASSRTVDINITKANIEDAGKEGPVKQVLARDGKIAAIRFYRERTPGMGLAEAKNYVEALERGGVIAARKSGGAGCFSVLVLAAVLLFSLALLFLLPR